MRNISANNGQKDFKLCRSSVRQNMHSSVRHHSVLKGRKQSRSQIPLKKSQTPSPQTRRPSPNACTCRPHNLVCGSNSSSRHKKNILTYEKSFIDFGLLCRTTYLRRKMPFSKGYWQVYLFFKNHCSLQEACAFVVLYISLIFQSLPYILSTLMSKLFLLEMLRTEAIQEWHKICQTDLVKPEICRTWR